MAISKSETGRVDGVNPGGAAGISVLSDESSP